MEKHSRRMEIGIEHLTKKWRNSQLRLVIEKLNLMKGWCEEVWEVRSALLEWMLENDTEVLVDEGEDILDGLEMMEQENSSGVTENIMIDATEIITAIIVANGLDTQRVAPIFQEDGKKTTEKIKRIGRAEGMIRMREEMRKLKNSRKKLTSRTIKDSDFEEMEVKEVRRKDCSRRMERGVLRSDAVDNKLVQDKGQRIQVIGADVEALYPSLSAVEVAEIVYDAVMKTEVKFDNINWVEACKYIALASTEQ